MSLDVSFEEPAHLMPLVRDLDFDPCFHSQLRGIAFQMASSNPDDTGSIRVVVTLQAIAALSGGHDYDDLAEAFAAFARERERIEHGASLKLARIGSLQAYEGIPTMLLMTGDPLPAVPHTTALSKAERAPSVAQETTKVDL